MNNIIDFNAYKKKRVRKPTGRARYRQNKKEQAAKDEENAKRVEYLIKKAFKDFILKGYGVFL